MGARAPLSGRKCGLSVSPSQCTDPWLQLTACLPTWTVAAWNTRGLLHTNPEMLRAKKAELERLSKGAEIV
eukprot:905327-Amphidinium_carterae.1